MNMSLAKAFREFCTNELIWFESTSYFFKNHPLLIIMFVLYAWEKIFAKAFPSTAVHIDLFNIDTYELYQTVKDVYRKNPCTLHVLDIAEPVPTIVKMLAKETKQLRKEKKMNARKAI